MHVLGLLVLAAEEGPSNPILPDKNELFWGFLAFIVLFVLMWKLAFPAVAKAMENRTNRIRKDLDDAERLKSEAQTILDQYSAQLQDAKSEANRIIEEARQTADQLRRDLMARAESEVAELRQRNADDINAAKDRTLADLRQQVAEIAIAAAERVVERNLDRDTNTALVENFISQVGAQR
ncbi:MAG: F-type H+-transporting ATPase subunit b [Acidimicrobiaceae bacterium]|jgi:F-type H+-transporting ATPase subunit b|nr:F-type H+-transporting ATPase subunit b [Acidimicrobiaceae bacterium]MDQ1446445.1 F-type H+-transporting ATPase subunit b [Acidimicrobiaceae bacterium]